MSEVEPPADPARTARPCPMCGETVQVLPHAGCVALFKEVMQSPPSTRSSIDDMPAEVEEVAGDATRKLNQYILVSQIGRGGMGIVWKAWDTKLTRWAAIKFLSAEEPSDVLRFEREAKLAARLRHPNIAAIYEVGESVAPVPGNPIQRYLAMEFIDGDPLSKIDTLGVRDWLQVFVQVCRAVDTAHQAGVVHRDLKPHNIMLTKERWPYVMDFGLAKSLRTDTSLSASGAVMGTPSYMPPEQAQAHHEEVDERSDTYSLGATLYSVLCKTFPFDGQSAIEVLGKVCNDQPRPPRELNPEIPEEIEAVLLKAMAKDKVDRYASAGEFADDLQLFLSAGEVAAVPPSRLKRTFRKVRRSPWTYLLTLAAAGALVAYLTLPGDSPGAPPLPRPPTRAEIARQIDQQIRNFEYEFKFASAHDRLEKNADVFEEDQRASIRDRIQASCTRYLKDELDEYLDKLQLHPSDGALADMAPPDFADAFELPPRDQLLLADEVRDIYAWSLNHTPALKKVHAGEETGRSLAPMALDATSLVEAGQNLWFLGIEAIFYDRLHTELTGLVNQAQHLPEAGRTALDTQVKELVAEWDAFLTKLEPEFMETHSRLQEHDAELRGTLDRWPKPIPHETLENIALGVLTKRATIRTLTDARSRLTKLDAPIGITLESRRELYTWMLIVDINRLLLEKTSEEQVARQSPELEPVAEKLWKLEGGPTDRYKSFGPRVTGVFAKLESLFK